MLVAVNNDYRQAVLDSLPWVFGAVVAMGVMAWMIVTIRAWFGDDADRMGCEQDLLTQLRDVHGEGQLSDEEFRSIKGRIIKNLTTPQSVQQDVIPSPSPNTPLPSFATPSSDTQSHLQTDTAPTSRTNPTLTNLNKTTTDDDGADDSLNDMTDDVPAPPK